VARLPRPPNRQHPHCDGDLEERQPGLRCLEEWSSCGEESVDSRRRRGADSAGTSCSGERGSVSEVGWMNDYGLITSGKCLIVDTYVGLKRYELR
jgi:hypothetical protein